MEVAHQALNVISYVFSHFGWFTSILVHRGVSKPKWKMYGKFENPYLIWYYAYAKYILE